MGWAGAGEPAEDPAENDIQDAVPLEWIREVEREKAAEEAAWRARRQRRIDRATWLVPLLAIGTCLIFMSVVWLLSVTHRAPVVLPTEVQAFAKSLPDSQRPNAAGVTLVDGTDAPNTWRVAWETADSAFCFAFVHESEPPQTVCDAPGSVPTVQLLIAGELNDTGIDPPELFTCGYATDSADVVSIDNDTVIGTSVDMGSGLSAYCLQLPDGTAAGASFTVTTDVVVSQGPDPRNAKGVTVTATYP